MVMTWRVAKPQFVSLTPEEVKTSGDFDLSLPINHEDFREWTFGSCPGRDPVLVISIPSDDEIYMGRERVELSELSTRLTYKLNGQHPSKEIFVKTSDFVKYRTFSSIIDKIHAVSNIRIALVKNKKREIKQP